MKVCMRNILLVVALVFPGMVRAQLFSGFSFITNNGAITITGYNPSTGLNMVIPAATNGYPVTAIGNGAFQLANLITNVVIPNTIGSMDDNAFYACIRLKSVFIPASVTNLGRAVFAYNIQLTNIMVDPANPAFSSLDGVLFNKSQTTLVEFPCGLGGSYTVPGSVTNIGWAAMSSCAISSLNIPSTVTFIEIYALNACLNLTNIAVAGANPNYVSVGGVLFDKAQTVLIQYPCALGSNYVVPNGVKEIYYDSFSYSGIARITLPPSVEAVDFESFYSCTNLGSVVIPGAVTNVGTDCFGYCTNLSTIYFLGNCPASDNRITYGGDVFYPDPITVYCLPGTTGWSLVHSPEPLPVLWNPQANSAHFTASSYGFNLTGPTNATIVVEASTNLNQPAWVPLATNKFSSGGTSVFNDAQAGNYPMRFYRLRSP